MLQNKLQFSFYDRKIEILKSLKLITKISIPLISSRIASTTSIFIGMLMVAKLGHKILAASALASTAVMTITVVISSLFFAIAVLVGHAHGANKPENVGGVIRESLALTIVVGIPTMFIMWHLGSLLLLLGQEKYLVDETIGYFHAFALGVFPNLWGLCFFQLVAGISKSKLITFWGLLWPVIFVPTGYILIFGKFGVPKLGLTGLGIATALTYWLVALTMIIQIGFGKSYKKYKIFSFRDSKKFIYIRELLSFGIFTASQVSAEFIAFSLSTIMIGWFGENSLAAQQIVLQTSAFLIVIPYGISQASGVLIGQAYGKKDFYSIRYIGYSGITLGAIFGIIFLILYCFFPKLIISLYLNPDLPANASTVHMAIILLAIGAVAQLFDFVRAITSGSLRGIYDNRVSMVVSIFISCLGALPLGYFLAYYFNLKAYGIRLAFVFSFLLGAIILFRRFKKLSDPEYIMSKQM
jgi:MATE family multidrug resistance protein